MSSSKLLSLFISFCLLFEQSLFAQAIDLSRYFVRNSGQNIPQSDKFRPLHLRYLGYDNLSQDFKILLDKGDAKKEDLENKAYIEENTQILLKYFFIGLSLPNEKFWVNLRPDSPDNILDPDLEKTDIGRIFLEADLQLKKDTASFTSPQNPQGKAYWDKLYKKAGELFPAVGGSAFGGGNENITIPTITRPWIVPGEIIIREAPDNAYIYKATLKVMLEEDYLTSRGGSRTATTPDQYTFSDPRLKELNQYSTQLIRETIIPKLTHEVNTSKRYAPLRQVYYSLILAQWFKQKYGSFGSIRAPGTSAPVNNYISMIDSGNLTNLTSSQPYDKQAYFKQYQKSFKDGEYNLQEPVYTPMGQSVRRYTSGGGQFGNIMNSASPIQGQGEVSSAITRRGFLLKSLKFIGAGVLMMTPLGRLQANEIKNESKEAEGVNIEIKLMQNLSLKLKQLINKNIDMPGDKRKKELEDAVAKSGDVLRRLTFSLEDISYNDKDMLFDIWDFIRQNISRVSLLEFIAGNQVLSSIIFDFILRVRNIEFQGVRNDVSNMVFSIYYSLLTSKHKTIVKSKFSEFILSPTVNMKDKENIIMLYLGLKEGIGFSFEEGKLLLELIFNGREISLINVKEILELQIPQYLRIYLWSMHYYLIRVNSDASAELNIDLPYGLAEDFIAQWKDREYEDIKHLISKNGRSVMGRIEYWHVAVNTALLILLDKHSKDQGVRNFLPITSLDMLKINNAGLKNYPGYQAYSNYSAHLENLRIYKLGFYFMVQIHELTHNKVPQGDRSISELVADLNALAFAQEKGWNIDGKFIETFMEQNKYNDRMSEVKLSRGVSDEEHQAARAQLGFITKLLEKEGIEVDWIKLRNVIFEELNSKNDLKLDELAIRVLNRMAGKKHKKKLKEESPPEGYKYRVFIPPEISSSPMDSPSASSAAEHPRSPAEVVNMLKERNWYYKKMSLDEREMLLKRIFNGLPDNFVPGIKTIVVNEMLKKGISVSAGSIVSMLVYGSWCYGFNSRPTDLDVVVVVNGLSQEMTLPAIKMNGIDILEDRRVDNLDIKVLPKYHSFDSRGIKRLISEVELWGHGILIYGEDLFARRPSDTAFFAVAKRFVAWAMVYSQDKTAAGSGEIKARNWRKILNRLEEAKLIFSVIQDEIYAAASSEAYNKIDDLLGEMLRGDVRFENLISRILTIDKEAHIKNISGSPVGRSAKSDVGGVDLSALPIQTESVSSSVLGALPVARAFKGDLDAEWAQIQAVFNAGIRPSAQRLADFAAAGVASPLASQRREDVLGLVAELLRRDEEDVRLAPIDPTLKGLLNALESLS